MLTLLGALAIAQSGDAADAAEAYRDLYHRVAAVNSLEVEVQNSRKGRWRQFKRVKFLRPNLFRDETPVALNVGDGSYDWSMAIPQRTYDQYPAAPDRFHPQGLLVGFEQLWSPDTINYAFEGIKDATFEGRSVREIDMNWEVHGRFHHRLYVDKQTGWPVGFTFLDRGKVGFSVRYVNLRINPPFRRSDFVFHPPADRPKK